MNFISFKSSIKYILKRVRDVHLESGRKPVFY